MNRRNFLKLTSTLAATPLLINGTALRSFATPSMLSCDGVSDRVLVIIQLAGGNDGLNMVIPISQYDNYANHRPSIALPDMGSNSIIPLDGTLPSDHQVGLHPAMTGIKDLYDAGKVNVIQSVGYEFQNKSHFKATDLWLTGGDGTSGNFNIRTGWIGRYLEHTFPSLAGNPTSVMLDPLGIELGDGQVSLGFHGEGVSGTSINLAQQDAASLYTLVSSIGGLPPANIANTQYGNELQYLISIQNSTNVYAERISSVFNGGNNAVVYPDYDLAKQLQTVARLISGGSKTKIFLVNLGGFDTHNGQVDSATTGIGKHADLLRELSDSVKAFQDDLTALSLNGRVATVTFSEFGRKVVENGSYGTDHGSLAPMLVFGDAIMPGVSGANPNLNNLDTRGALAETERQFDYRQVYTTILQDWLGASDDAIAATMFTSFLSQKLGLIDTNYLVTPDCYIDNIAGSPSVLVKTNAFIQGAYDVEEGLMLTHLLDNGLLPLSQPFDMDPWFYAGTEVIPTLNKFPPNTIDWVLVEIRDAADMNQIIEQKAALLLADGRIVDFDNVEGVHFFNLVDNTPYYMSVRARNHLAVISSNPIVVPNVNTFDLTNPANIMGGISQLVLVDNNIYGLMGGDFDGDGVISVEDYNRFQQQLSGINTYQLGDGNLDGNITTTDFNIYRPNASKIGVPILRY